MLVDNVYRIIIFLCVSRCFVVLACLPISHSLVGSISSPLGVAPSSSHGVHCLHVKAQLNFTTGLSQRLDAKTQNNGLAAKFLQLGTANE